MNRPRLDPRPQRPVRSALPVDAILRVGARAVDFMLALVAVTVGSLVPGAKETATATTVSFWFVAGAVSLTEGGLLAVFGRTPGMALCGLRVSTVDGGRVPFWRAITRSATVWVSIMVGCFESGAAGPIVLAASVAAMLGPMILRADGRGGHDLIAGTRVVRTPTFNRFLGIS